MFYYQKIFLNPFSNSNAVSNPFNLPPFLQQFFENMTPADTKKEQHRLNSSSSNSKDENLNKSIIKSESSKKLESVDQNEKSNKSSEKNKSLNNDNVGNDFIDENDNFL